MTATARILTTTAARLTDMKKETGLHGSRLKCSVSFSRKCSRIIFQTKKKKKEKEKKRGRNKEKPSFALLFKIKNSIK